MHAFSDNYLNYFASNLFPDHAILYPSLSDSQIAPGEVRELSTTSTGADSATYRSVAKSVAREFATDLMPWRRRYERLEGPPAVPTTVAPMAVASCTAASPRPPVCQHNYVIVTYLGGAPAIPVTDAPMAIANGTAASPKPHVRQMSFRGPSMAEKGHV